ncbi:MAG: CPBP family intramembrane glutamic endopeptidase, partial [Bacteroidota bacterium]
WMPALLAVAITICFMFVNSIFIEWNQGIDFPDALDWFENYAQEQEDSLEQITIFLTSFDSTWKFIVSLIVIALIPAVGEEFLFRGLIQNEVHRATRNIHVAIWGSAFFFAFFHLQFYGLVPRMLLGALFGYLYYWSGSLTYASIAHFVNNGFTLVMLYLYQIDLIDFDIQETESTPLETVVIFFIIGSLLTYLFVRHQHQKTLSPPND